MHADHREALFRQGRVGPRERQLRHVVGRREPRRRGDDELAPAKVVQRHDVVQPLQGRRTLHGRVDFDDVAERRGNGDAVAGGHGQQRTARLLKLDVSLNGLPLTVVHQKPVARRVRQHEASVVGKEGEGVGPREVAPDDGRRPIERAVVVVVVSREESEAQGGGLEAVARRQRQLQVVVCEGQAREIERLLGVEAEDARVGVEHLDASAAIDCRAIRRDHGPRVEGKGPVPPRPRVRVRHVQPAQLGVQAARH
mmetsp:Transcript_1511/g.4490  ORF Transcript_1511/g.4490 Transcript_1511/m.4490 type:complete len:254 (+) Transcript_1511:2132-2893(+)